MNDQSDSQLLHAYAERRAEPAFAELVRRHVDFVYSAARRMVCDSHLAEDVAQGVFIALAKNARQLMDRPVLSGWLHRTAQNIAAQTVRSDVRRRTREQEAAAMNELLSAEPGAYWERIAPHLDAGLGELSEPDRDALLLRYFERKSAREMAQTLGISDEAAQKRVSRAVERLREFFAKRGINVGTSGMVAVISAHAVQAAPAGLAATISSAAALASLGILPSAGGGATTFATLWHAFQTKLLVGLAATVLIGVGISISFRSLHRTESDAASDALPITAAIPEQNPQAARAAAPDASVAADQREPDPLSLLLAVAQARQRIGSGALEFQLSIEHFGRARRENNQLSLAVLFDGPKLRCEQLGREYSYTYSDDETEQDEIKKQADSLDQEAAVRAGLLKPFESHRTLAYDGAVVLNYWENDGKPVGASIIDPNKGSGGGFLFDPRCLGLRTSVSVGSTVENCLGYNGAKSIDLVGEELVDGIPAWHVQVRNKYDEALHFWIEIAHPDRLLKHAYGSNVVVSKYDASDPIPIEVTTMDFRNGSPTFAKRFVQTKSQLNLEIDASSFTLAGLGMPAGTSVSDNRIMRRIGYWNGTGLSEDLPAKQGTEPQPPPHLVELLTLLENQPSSPEALDAAAWILLNTPDGPEVEKAAEVILQEHTGDTNLVYFCQEMERVRHRCAKPLLKAILKNNPSAEVRGIACFTLATLLKDEAKYGQNKPATTEAEKQFERTLAEFGQIQHRGGNLEHLAKPELSELRRLTIGKPAPEIAGRTLDGQPMKLSDYRGKVVLLVFWTTSTASDAAEHRKFVERMAGKPFALIGVNCDRNPGKAKAAVEKHEITWPSFWDGRDGPISKNWNVQSWSDIWVLDPQGVIRYRNVRGRALNEAVDTLLGE